MRLKKKDGAFDIPLSKYVQALPNGSIGGSAFSCGVWVEGNYGLVRICGSVRSVVLPVKEIGEHARM